MQEGVAGSPSNDLALERFKLECVWVAYCPHLCSLHRTTKVEFRDEKEVLSNTG